MPHTLTPDTIGAWLHHAKERHRVLLANGMVAELVGVRKRARSCKIRVHNRHYQCWVEDIVAVSDETIDSCPDSSEIVWKQLEPWRVVEIDFDRGDVFVRTSSAPPSKSWLTIEHARAVS